jgi:hypothetical protein
MDCAFFNGDLSREEREFLAKLLQSYNAATMIRSWAELGCARKGGACFDSNKTKAAEILKRSKVLCRRARAHVYAIEAACFLFNSRAT